MHLTKVHKYALITHKIIRFFGGGGGCGPFADPIPTGEGNTPPQSPLPSAPTAPGFRSFSCAPYQTLSPPSILRLWRGLDAFSVSGVSRPHCKILDPPLLVDREFGMQTASLVLCSRQ